MSPPVVSGQDGVLRETTGGSDGVSDDGGITIADVTRSPLFARLGERSYRSWLAEPQSQIPYRQAELHCGHLRVLVGKMRRAAI